MIARAAAALVAVGAAALAFWLAAHHPLSAPVAVVAGGAVALFTLARPGAWPLIVLPLLPVAGLMPWTGWLVVEESDLLLLAAAAGAYARWAWRWPVTGPERPARASWCLLLLLLSVVISLWRGVLDAGGFSWGWWQGYHEPLNSLRLAKPVFGLLLWLPLWRAGVRRDALAGESALRWGMVGLLSVVGGCVLWERLAYTGLLDFSSDYRVTGLFWEMHVGGAALDAALALGLPFALLALRRAGTPWRGGLAAMALLLGAYAALVTFSRILYLALPLGLLLTWALARRQHGAPVPGQVSGIGPGLAWSAGTAAAALLLFPVGGYRGLLALLGTVALVLPLAGHLRRLPAAAWGPGTIGALMAAAGAVLLAWALPKGAYVVYGAVWCCGLVLLRLPVRGRAQGAAAVMVVAALLAALVVVPVHWGGWPALGPAVGVAVVLGAVLFVAVHRPAPLWPDSLRWQVQLLLVLTLGAGLVGVFGGGAYMAQRLTGVADDGAGRQGHWRQALDQLDAGDWAFGKGLGRFLAHHALSGRVEDQVGDLRLAPGPGGSGQVLVLSSGKHEMSGGELLRLSQRVAEPASGALRLRLDMHVERPVLLHISLCEKHLLYQVHCVDQNLEVRPAATPWQPVQVALGGRDLTRGAALAPRWIVLSVALASAGRRAEIDHLTLIDAAGRSLLANGDFEDGLARWFFSSDRHHMPWHAKNLAVHLLFEQGLFGLAAWTLAFGVALWRLSLGAARRHALAPALAGALVALLVVGLVDSLFDMPRIGFVSLLLVAVALSLPAARLSRGAPGKLAAGP